MYLVKLKNNKKLRLAQYEPFKNSSKIHWSININNISKGRWYIKGLPIDLATSILEFCDLDYGWYYYKLFDEFKLAYKKLLTKTITPLLQMTNFYDKLDYIFNVLSKQMQIGYLFYTTDNELKFYPNRLLRKWLCPMILDNQLRIPIVDNNYNSDLDNNICNYLLTVPIEPVISYCTEVQTGPACVNVDLFLPNMELLTLDMEIILNVLIHLSNVKDMNIDYTFITDVTNKVIVNDNVTNKTINMYIIYPFVIDDNGKCVGRAKTSSLHMLYIPGNDITAYWEICNIIIKVLEPAEC